MIRAALALLAALPLCVACIAPASRWHAGTGARVGASADSSIVVPAGWKHTQNADELLVSLDGPGLQAIRVTFQRQGVKSRRPYDAGALPSELAEQFAAELEAITDGQVELLANEPATVGGKPGFRLRARHNLHAQRMPVDLYEIYGVGHGEGLYVLTYGAYETHYFARDLAAFEEVVRSFQLP